MPTNYQRGREVEYKAMRQLEGVGYDVLRTAGSHGVFDLIAYNNLGVRFIQCKREAIPQPDSYEIAREKIREEPLPPNSTGELWVWVDSLKKWAIQETIKIGGRS